MTAEDQMCALVRQQRTDELTAAYRTLDAKPTRSAAERLSYAVIASELEHRERSRTSELSDEKLRELFEANTRIDFRATDSLTRLKILAVSEVVQDRWPDAAHAADVWLDSLDASELCKAGPNAWEKRLLQALGTP